MTYPANSQGYAQAYGASLIGAPVIQPRDPSSTDTQYPIYTRWFNKITGAEWILKFLNKTAGSTVATWQEQSTTAGAFLSLSDTANTKVFPTLGNIQLVGATSQITVVSTPASSLLTIGLNADVPTSFSADTGSAIPASNVLTIHGSTGVATSGSGSTISVGVTAAVPTSFNGDSGTAVPAANVLTLAGSSGTGIVTSATGSTVTTATSFASIAASKLSLFSPGDPAGIIIDSAGTVVIPLKGIVGLGTPILSSSFLTVAADLFSVVDSTTGAIVSQVYNSSGAGTATAVHEVFISGSTALSAYSLYGVSGVNAAYAGILGSDQSFRIGTSVGGPGTQDFIVIQNPGHGNYVLVTSLLKVGNAINTMPGDSSHTTTTGFGTSATAGTAKQNVQGYDILVNISVTVSTSTGGSIVLGVGSTNTPTTDTVVAAFTVAASTVFNFSAYIPNAYYMLVNGAGTITISSITTQACPI